jgi:hypothetical protein
MSIVSEYRAAAGWKNNGDAEGFKLARAYRATRARMLSRGFNASPSRCLQIARDDVARGAAFYPPADLRPGAAGERGGRWCASPEALGFRLVGFADECGGRHFRRVEHSGWYLSPHGDDSAGLARGAVYQLPSRGGRSVYVEALRTGESGDSGWQDMGESGSAMLFLNCLHYGEPGGRDCDTEPAMLDAASGADQEARFYAEREREWQEAHAAGRDCAEADATATSERAEARRLVRELRDVRRELNGRPFPTLCAALRSAIRLHLERACTAREKAADLRRDWSGFAGTFRAHLSEAFAEGLGE